MDQIQEMLFSIGNKLIISGELMVQTAISYNELTIRPEDKARATNYLKQLNQKLEDFK